MRAVTTTRSIRIRDRDGIVTPSTGLMKVGARAMLLFGVLLALVLGINELNVLNNYVGRDFMTALEAGGFGASARTAAGLPHDKI